MIISRDKIIEAAKKFNLEIISNQGKSGLLERTSDGLVALTETDVLKITSLFSPEEISHFENYNSDWLSDNKIKQLKPKKIISNETLFILKEISELDQKAVS